MSLEQEILDAISNLVSAKIEDGFNLDLGNRRDEMLQLAVREAEQNLLLKLRFLVNMSKQYENSLKPDPENGNGQSRRYYGLLHNYPHPYFPPTNHPWLSSVSSRD